MKRINKIRVNNFAGMIKMTDSGETLIKKCQRILDEGEPLTDGAPMIYTPKQAGVKPECNVRADKWDIAMKAMDRVNSYKLTEYLKEGTTEAPNKPDGQKNGGATESNLQMWKDTNFGAQRAEMEDAGLSVGLMYGNGGGQAASTAGGDATQPNAPKTNPVEVALQQQALGLQLKQIEAQNKLANAETAKTLAEANKIAGVDTEGAKLDNEWYLFSTIITSSRCLYYCLYPEVLTC
jgi:hypothetical protein